MGSEWLDRWRRIRRLVRLWVAWDMRDFGDLSEPNVLAFHAEYLHATADLTLEERRVAHRVYQNVKRFEVP